MFASALRKKAPLHHFLMFSVVQQNITRHGDVV